MTDNIKLKGVVMEDFVNYKVPSMFLITSKCDWKCCRELGIDISICQNEPMAQQITKDISKESIYKAYINNDITKAVVFGGLEPMLQFNEVLNVIQYFREQGCNDIFVIYTGYYPQEIVTELNHLRHFDNIIVKFGRYIPNRPSRYDDVLGITLVSDNQYAERIS